MFDAAALSCFIFLAGGFGEARPGHFFGDAGECCCVSLFLGFLMLHWHMVARSVKQCCPV